MSEPDSPVLLNEDAQIVSSEEQLSNTYAALVMSERYSKPEISVMLWNALKR